MVKHYLAIALRNLRRSPFTALINVVTLALGLVAFVGAYAVVAYWDGSDRHFANTDRTYVITASLALRDGSIATGTMPSTNELYERYLRLEFPEFEAIVRANVWNQQASITADGRGARVIAVAVDPAFLDIFELPFVSGDARHGPCVARRSLAHGDCGCAPVRHDRRSRQDRDARRQPHRCDGHRVSSG